VPLLLLLLQIRARRLFPSMLGEFIGAVLLSINLGLSLRFSIFRYSGTIIAGIATAAALELRSRRAFLQRMTAQDTGKQQQQQQAVQACSGRARQRLLG
jgi:hypothetical protein